MGNIINFIQKRNDQYARLYYQVQNDHQEPHKLQILSELTKEQQRFNMFCFQQKMKFSQRNIFNPIFNKVSNNIKY